VFMRERLLEFSSNANMLNGRSEVGGVIDATFKKQLKKRT